MQSPKTQDAKPEASFADIARHFSSAERIRFEAFLERVGGLHATERECVRLEADHMLCSETRQAMLRVLVLELHAARLTGALPDGDPQRAFDTFVRQTTDTAFGKHLRVRYPSLQGRLTRMLQLRRRAFEQLLSDLLVDRELLVRRFGVGRARLTAIESGHGDPHHGGRTVAKIVFDDGVLMYKPRPMRLDACLDAFLDRVFSGVDARVRVPAVLDRGTHGWAEFIGHRYCGDDAELDRFHRNLGAWLAIMHLLGGTDVHCDNLIASGPVPVVVDPECLFVDGDDIIESAYGDAHAEAVRVLAQSVLRTSILPNRLPQAAFRGVDISSMGASAEQRSHALAPTLVDADSLDARIDDRRIALGTPRSLPAPAPCFLEHVEAIVEGFAVASARLRDLDSDGALRPLLATFEGCRARTLFRPTQTYAELRHMLWHPASLHAPDTARRRAVEALSHGAGARTPDAGRVARELADLEVRDIPAFESTVDVSRIDAALGRWRADAEGRQERILRGALVAADWNLRTDATGGREGLRGVVPDSSLDAVGLDGCRRRLAKSFVQDLLDTHIGGHDATVAWLGLNLGTNGWGLEPSAVDFYGGLGGIAFALAAYAREASCDRVDAVDGLSTVLEGCLRSLRKMERTDHPCRLGGFNGMGGRIWQWQLLHALLGVPECLHRAVRWAGTLFGHGLDGDAEHDILSGQAGLIVPLLQLAETTGDERWLALAARIGRRLEDAAIFGRVGACWPSRAFQEPIGGFAHGATGIGWALARLSISAAGCAASRRRWSRLAEAAFAFEQSLYDARRRAWRDLRSADRDACSTAWCHGAVGIGLAASDLYFRTGDESYRHTLQLAVQGALEHGWRRDTSLCHGSFGLRELLLRGMQDDADAGAGALGHGDRTILSVLGQVRGKSGRMAAERFVPGLMTGLSGVVIGLCRMHPCCDLPSPLLMETRSVVAGREAAAVSN